MEYAVINDVSVLSGWSSGCVSGDILTGEYRLLFLEGLRTLRSQLFAQYLYTWKTKTTLRMDTLKVPVLCL